MATIHGKDADVTVATGDSEYVLNAHAWSLDIECDAAETTNWTESGPDGTDYDWRTYIAGLRGFSGSWDCYLDDMSGTDSLADMLPGATLTVNFFVDKSNTVGYSGDCLITGVSPDVDIDGVEELSVDFQGSGELSTSTV